MIPTVVSLLLLVSGLSLQSQTKKGQIDFSKEQPVHPYYETLGGNGSLNCKEKQECMSNCTSSVYVYTNRGKSLETARQGCIADCNRIVCLPENKK